MVNWRDWWKSSAVPSVSHVTCMTTVIGQVSM